MLSNDLTWDFFVVWQQKIGKLSLQAKFMFLSLRNLFLSCCKIHPRNFINKEFNIE